MQFRASAWVIQALVFVQGVPFGSALARDCGFKTDFIYRQQPVGIVTPSGNKLILSLELPERGLSPSYIKAESSSKTERYEYDPVNLKPQRHPAIPECDQLYRDDRIEYSISDESFLVSVHSQYGIFSLIKFDLAGRSIDDLSSRIHRYGPPRESGNFGGYERIQSYRGGYVLDGDPALPLRFYPGRFDAELPIDLLSSIQILDSTTEFLPSFGVISQESRGLVAGALQLYAFEFDASGKPYALPVIAMNWKAGLKLDRVMDFGPSHIRFSVIRQVSDIDPALEEVIFDVESTFPVPEVLPWPARNEGRIPFDFYDSRIVSRHKL